MRTLSAILLSTLALLALACGNPVSKVREAAERSKQQNDLKQLGLAIHSFNDKNMRTPQNFDELDKSGFLDGPEVASQVRSGQITVIWGFNLTKSFDKVVAYRSAANGMYIVLFGDGSVRQETQSTFGTLPQAVPAPPGEKDDKEDKGPRTPDRKNGGRE